MQFEEPVMIQSTTFRYVAIATGLIAALFTQGARADWQVDSNASDFHFVTTKAGAAGSSTITEVQRFKQIGGTVNSNGKINFNVQTASVDTLIPIRDERLRELLFKSVNFPQASFSGQVEMESIKALKPGDEKDVDVAGDLTLAGVSKPATAKLRVVRLSANRLLVSTREPLIVNANDYSLQAGVEALRTVMGLNVLSPSAPVDFSMVLTQK
jgi:polyisoprenoid-binding protein YceI